MTDAEGGLTIRVVIACPACGVGWLEGADALCIDPHHEHSRRERHRHRTPVALPGGAVVWAASFEESDGDPYARETVPDFGLYLDEKWAPPWKHTILAWPDFGVPSDVDDMRETLADALVRAKAGDRIEIGCWGGHGRTGTAIGCLAVIDGHAADTAVAWVRENYCVGAIETPAQEAFVAAFTAS